MATTDLTKFIRKGSLWTIETLLNKAVISDLITTYNHTTGLRASMTSTNIYRGVCFLAKCVNLSEGIAYVRSIEPKTAKGFKEDLGQYKGGRTAIVGGITALLTSPYDENNSVGKHFFGIDFKFERKEVPPHKEEEKEDQKSEEDGKQKPLSFAELSQKKSFTNVQRLNIYLNQKLRTPVYAADGRTVERYQAVYLKGEAGCGKTESVYRFADLNNLRVVLIPQCSFVENLVGSTNLDGTFRETALAKALKGEKGVYTNEKTGRTYDVEGIVVLFDECDSKAMGEEVLIAMNNLISQGVITINEKTVTVPENFRIVCAGNTGGFGATEMYNSRNPIDASFMDRLVYISYDYEKDIENTIVDAYGEQIENPRIIAEFYRDLRRAKVLNDTNWILSYRGIETFCANMIATKSIEEGLRSCIIKGLEDDPDALNQIASKMTKKENPIYKVFQKLVAELGA